MVTAMVGCICPNHHDMEREGPATLDHLPHRSDDGGDVRILFVEDSPDDVELMVHRLRHSGFEPTWRQVDSERALRDALGHDGWQLAIVDYAIPGFSGPAALQVIADTSPDLPAIVASGHAPEEVVAETARLGAVDYLLKDNLERLAPAVRHALAEGRTRLERAEAVRALRRSELRYRTMFDDAPIGLAEIDLVDCHAWLHELDEQDGAISRILLEDPERVRTALTHFRIISVNDQIVSLLEADSEREVAERFIDCIPDDALPAVCQALETVVHAAGTSTVELPLRTLKGARRTVVMNATALTEKQRHSGTERRALVSMTDITARRAAEEALRARERTLETITSNFPGVVYRCAYDEDLTSMFESKGVVGLTGYPVEHFVGARGDCWRDIMHPDDGHWVREATIRAVEQHRPFTFTYRIVTRGGQEKWVWEHGEATYGADGEAQFIEGFLLDITEQKHLSDELGQTKDRLERALAGSNAVVYSTLATPPYATTYLSPNATELTGYEVEERHPDPFFWRSHLHPEDLAIEQAGFERVMQEGHASLQYRFRVADGSYRWFRDEMQIVRATDGSPAEIVGEFWDITAEREMETAMRESERRLALRSRIAHAFLTASGEQVFAAVLEIVQSAMHSPQGVFAYLDDDGDLVIPSASSSGSASDVDAAKEDPVRVPRDVWARTVWGQALTETQTQVIEGPCDMPYDCPPRKRALATPLVQGGTSVGLLMVADKQSPYTDAERGLLEDAAGYTAAILHEWLQRGRFEDALRRSQEQLELRNRIANAFLTTLDDEVYANVLDVFLEALHSPYGVFGYLENGQMVVPSLTRDVWDQCDLPDKSLRFDLAPGGTTEEDAIAERRTIVRNERRVVPKGHVPVERVMATPIMYRDEPIGHFAVANKPTDYTAEDVEQLELLATYVAPVLDARLQRQRAEEAERAAKADLASTADRLRRTVRGVIDAMGQVVEMRDPYTAGHERRVARLAVRIARALDMSDEDVEILDLAARVHDVGKIAVPAEILARPGRLQPTEMSIIQTHPVVGHGILRSVDVESPLAEIVLQHHERLDGSGYPRGLKGDQILPVAKVLAVADVVEAMASHRPYRPALGIETALAEVKAHAGTKFDAGAVEACERVVREPGFAFDE